MFTSPWIADVQENAPDSGTNFPAGGPPQYPSAAFQGKIRIKKQN